LLAPRHQNRVTDPLVTVNDTQLVLKGSNVDTITIPITNTTTLWDLGEKLVELDPGLNWKFTIEGLPGNKLKLAADLVDFTDLDPKKSSLEGGLSVPILSQGAESLVVKIEPTTTIKDLVGAINQTAPFRAESIGHVPYAENTLANQLVQKEVQVRTPRFYSATPANLESHIGVRLGAGGAPPILKYISRNPGNAGYVSGGATPDVIFRSDDNKSLLRFKVAHTVAHEGAGHPVGQEHVTTRTIMYDPPVGTYLSALGYVNNFINGGFAIGSIVYTVPTEYDLTNKKTLKLK
jgi:hypothetical protein